MSLSARMSAEFAALQKCSVILKTADQYDIWKNRVTDACCTMNVFNLTDEDCSRAMDEFVEAKEAGEKKQNWVATCWQIITTSLHDDVYRKVSQSPRGGIETLLKNIGHALVFGTCVCVLGHRGRA